MSNYLKRKLEEKHISQSEFARRLGVTRAYVCDIVHDRASLKNMPINKIFNMSIILDIPLEEFLKGVFEDD